jgi:hypothetical protein
MMSLIAREFKKLSRNSMTNPQHKCETCECKFKCAGAKPNTPGHCLCLNQWPIQVGYARYLGFWCSYTCLVQDEFASDADDEENKNDPVLAHDDFLG